MRMWMVDPKIMCRQHLLGEHLETHMFLDHIVRKRSLTGYIEGNLLEPRSLVDRHEALVKEMLTRGYRHSTPMPKTLDLSHMSPWQQNYMIDRSGALTELLGRCEKCKEQYDVIYRG